MCGPKFRRETAENHENIQESEYAADIDSALSTVYARNCIKPLEHTISCMFASRATGCNENIITTA
jgi:hypothetical protein